MKLNPSIRQQMRAERRQLSPQQQRQRARQLSRLLARQPLFLRSNRIAFFWPSDGELDPLLLMQRALKQGKRCYLPIVSSLSVSGMQFAEFTADTPLATNRFGIPEPKAEALASPKTLDLVLTPLVAFDHDCNRLGMGGGFYDRTFAFKQKDSGHAAVHNKPFLLGIAHGFQQVDQLQQNTWDVPLNAVATEEHIVSRHSAGRDFLVMDMKKMNQNNQLPN